MKSADAGIPAKKKEPTQKVDDEVNQPGARHDATSQPGETSDKQKNAES